MIFFTVWPWNFFFILNMLKMSLNHQNNNYYHKWIFQSKSDKKEVLHMMFAYINLVKINFSITWPRGWPFDIEDDLQSWK